MRLAGEAKAKAKEVKAKEAKANEDKLVEERWVEGYIYHYHMRNETFRDCEQVKSLRSFGRMVFWEYIDRAWWNGN